MIQRDPQSGRPSIFDLTPTIRGFVNALKTLLYAHNTRHENGGADEVSVAGLSGLLADDQHVLDAEVTAVAIALSQKAAASGVASLDGSTLVVQNPANATATPTASKLPIADGSGLLDGWVTANGKLGSQTELTIATGVITITKSYHSVDTQDDDPTDNLDTINGGVEGQILIIRANNVARTIVVKNGTGNIVCGTDCTLDSDKDTWTALYDGASWIELSRSDNSP